MTENKTSTKIIVGLGNPGAKYKKTRHNIGFEVIDHLAAIYGNSIPKSKFDGQVVEILVKDRKICLVWPLTYMNSSGRCVKAFIDFYKLDPTADLLVICDDLSLPLGKLRMKPKGSAGGQKGLNDILRATGTQEIDRLRIGIDPTPPRWETADYVLSQFRSEEITVVDDAVKNAANATIDWALHGPEYCMNQIN